MSPEQVSGGSLDHRSDLFSFGLILSEMLTGRHPFRRGSALETMRAIMRDPPDLAARGSSDVPPGLGVLIRRLLAKSPEDRYRSMSEARADLARLATASAAEPTQEAAPQVPLIGRDDERAELLRLLEAALAGRGSLTLIGGEPGIGKTHLTRAILQEAARRGCFTVVGHCYELEGAPPYVPFIEMLEYGARTLPRESFRYALGEAAPEIAKLMPELRRIFPDIPPPVELPPEQQRRFLFNAYREFVERAARVTPFVGGVRRPALGRRDHPAAARAPGAGRRDHAGAVHWHLSRRGAGRDAAVRPDAGKPPAAEAGLAHAPCDACSPGGVEAMLGALSGQTPPPVPGQDHLQRDRGQPVLRRGGVPASGRRGQAVRREGALATAAAGR